jgi:hypothetical protein
MVEIEYIYIYNSFCDRTMAERAKVLKIYGPEFCAEEVMAVAGMEKMFLHEQQLIAYSKRRHGGDNAAHEGVSEEKVRDEAAVDSTDAAKPAGSDMRLPPWVLQQLELMRNAGTERGTMNCPDYCW